MNPALPAVSGDARLFFAVLPSQRARPSIDRLGRYLQQAHHLHGQRVPPDRQHVTVAPIHDAHASLRDVIVRAQSVGAAFRHHPFLLEFEWSASFRLKRDTHPLVLRGDAGVQSLMEFQRDLRAAIRRAGFAVPSSYTPHITLLWADRPVEAYPIAPIGWAVRDFVLVLSIAGQGHHTHVGRWPLQ